MALHQSEWFEILFDKPAAENILRLQSRLMKFTLLLVAIIGLAVRFSPVQTSNSFVEAFRAVPVFGTLDLNRDLFSQACKPEIGNAFWICQLISTLSLITIALVAAVVFFQLYSIKGNFKLIASKVPIVNPSSMLGVVVCGGFCLFVLTDVSDGMIVGNYKARLGTNDFVFAFFFSLLYASVNCIWHFVLNVYLLFFTLTRFAIDNT